MGCTFCGSMRSSQDCEAVACLGCGAVQCHGNGLGRGTCRACHYGILPGWSGSDCRCSYKGCASRATFRYVPRVGNVCAAHAERAKVGSAKRGFKTLREYAADKRALLPSAPSWARTGTREC
jgi:hypothetical protein